MSVIPNFTSEEIDTNKVALSSILPEGTVCWIFNMQHLLDKVHDAYEKSTGISLADIDQNDEALKGFLREQPFLVTRDVMSGFGNYDLIYQHSEGAEPLTTLDFNSTPQPIFNKNFGSAFRTFHNRSYFSDRLMRLSDIYTSRLPNLLQFSLDHTFYSRRIPLPHEQFFR